MKPIRLRMQAFGPYATLATVDFRVVDGGGLFLIHGQTGAGKTSILDGLCFALFGRASGGEKGAERSPENLRCDLAKADLATEVSLEFALGPDIYRVTRSPRQQLKKLRGEGLRTVLPDGRLEKLEAGFGAQEIDVENWSPLANGDRKTDEFIGKILGMTEEQFRQVVVLPQGQFRRFLAASSESREDLLERLFRAGRFRKLVDRLDQLAKTLAGEITQCRLAMQAHLGALQVESRAKLAEQLNESRARSTELSGDQDAFEQRYREAALRLERAKSAANTKSQLAQITARHATLAGRREQNEEIVRRLENERRARPVVQIDARLQAVDQEISRAQGEIRSGQAQLSEFERDLTQDRERWNEGEKRRPEIVLLGQQVQELREHYVNAKSLSETEAKKTQFKQQITEVEKETRILENRAGLLLRDREKIQTQLADLVAKSGRIEALQSRGLLKTRELTEHRLFTQLSVEREQLDKHKSASERAFREANDEATKTQQELTQTRIRFHLSQAARLALTLEPGAPCPVCGSAQHPSPAHFEQTAPTEETLNALEVRVQAADARKTEKNLDLSRLQAELARADREWLARWPEALGSRPDSFTQRDLQPREQTLQSEFDAIEKEVREAKDAASQVEIGRLEARKFEMDQANVDRLKLDADRLLTETRAALNEMSLRIKSLEQVLPPDLRDLEAIKRRGAQLNETISVFEKSQSAWLTKIEKTRLGESGARATIDTITRTLNSKLSEKQKLDADLDEALSTSGFATTSEVRAAHVDPAEVVNLEKRRRDFENESAAVQAQLQKLKDETNEIPEWANDRDQIETVFLEIDQERTRRHADRQSLQERMARLSIALEQMIERETELEKLTRRFEVVGRLSEVASGRPPNLTRVNFQRYVLAAQLDEVLLQASRRLFDMSRGQFILKRARQAEDKRKNAGLDLEVEDAFTGTSRPTSSLSGGEGFLASLALALGLADVVQSHLGGIRLDAVFVDEGFGTLDPEALEQAMKTLGELQAGGRLVGIISHVPELREQIARRLVVSKTPEGSTINWETA